MNSQIEKIIKEAGLILEEGFNNFQIYKEKERQHLQSEYDVKVDNFLKDFFRINYPKDSIYSEETEEIKGHSNIRWIIDPIDGTTYFICGEPFFSISIAKELDGEIVEAHVYNPISKEYYYSDKITSKSYLNNIEISVSKTETIEESLLAFGFSANPKNIRKYLDKWEHLMTESKKAITWIGPALSICNVARGRVDAFIDFGCSFEGQAAASFILKNAGGYMTNYNNDKYDTTVIGGIFTNGLIKI